MLPDKTFHGNLLIRLKGMNNWVVYLFHALHCIAIAPAGCLCQRKGFCSGLTPIPGEPPSYTRTPRGFSSTLDSSIKLALVPLESCKNYLAPPQWYVCLAVQTRLRRNAAGVPGRKRLQLGLHSHQRSSSAWLRKRSRLEHGRHNYICTFNFGFSVQTIISIIIFSTMNSNSYLFITILWKLTTTYLSSNKACILKRRNRLQYYHIRKQYCSAWKRRPTR